MKRFIPLLVAISLTLLSCGGRKPAAPAPEGREFPLVTVPSMYTDPAERTEYAAGRFWDAFLDTAALYRSDSAFVNGVPAGDVESMMANYVALAGNLPLAGAADAVRHFAAALGRFGAKYPDAPVWTDMVSMTEKYLFDPNSPMRDEDLYGPFVAALAELPSTPEDRRNGFRWIASMCEKNRRGTPAADFSFTDTQGRRRTLYGIKAERILLIFGNPDCTGCREILHGIAGDPHLSELVSSGRLKVVDVYIDEDVAEWKAGIGDYPRDWINGYDHARVIRGDVVYNVRALPSLYLLDENKTVLLKDAPADRILSVL